MRTILCYGDSNTWGKDPESEGRFSFTIRWPGVLQQQLGMSFRVIEEGLCGRTTVFDDPLSPWRNGKQYLMPCLESHKPIDLCIIMLGTNDLKTRFSLTAAEIAEGAEMLIDLVHSREAGSGAGSPPVLLVSPPLVRGDVPEHDMLIGAAQKSRSFAACYRETAERTGCLYFDAACIEVSELDGVHISEEGHRMLGEKLASVILKYFQDYP